MARKRPCRICRRWFRPDPRVGVRQRTCGARACQRGWHRRTCRDWRRRHPDYDRDDRLRRRLQVGERAEARRADPLAQMDWEVAREAMGLQAAVVVEETGRVLVRWAREEIAPQGAGSVGEMGRLPGRGGRDAMGDAMRAP